MGKNYEIISGDALAVLDQLPAQSYDALITDPPYSVMSTARGNVKYFDGMTSSLSAIACDDMDQRAWSKWCCMWLCAARRCLKPGAPILVFCAWKQIPCLTDALQWANVIWRGVVSWDKISSRPYKGRFKHQAEFIVWGSLGKLDVGHERCLPGAYRVQHALCSQKERVHVMQKPLELLRQLVRITRDGGKILDPFCGSGTTVAAALLEGYTATGIEIDPDMAAKADKRVRDFIGV